MSSMNTNIEGYGKMIALEIKWSHDNNVCHFTAQDGAINGAGEYDAQVNKFIWDAYREADDKEASGQINGDQWQQSSHQQRCDMLVDAIEVAFRNFLQI